MLANLLVLPGLGSVLGGRRCGWTQMVVAVTGFGLTMWWAISFVIQWVRDGAFPMTGGSQLWAGLGGLIMFIGAWGWGLVSGLQLLRAAPERR